MNHTKAVVKDTNNTLNQLCDVIEKFLYENKIYNYEAVYESNGHIVIDVDGDWKHDHLFIKNLIQDNFPYLTYIYTDSKDTSDDCYFGSQYYLLRA